MHQLLSVISRLNGGEPTLDCDAAAAAAADDDDDDDDANNSKRNVSLQRVLPIMKSSVLIWR